MIDDFTPLKGLKILYIDDELSARELMREMLQKRFKEVFIAQNGLEGLKIAKEAKPDVIVSDFRMPSMGGGDMYLELKKAGFDIPMVFLTAYADEVEFEESIKIVEKPFRKNELLGAVMEVCGL